MCQVGLQRFSGWSCIDRDGRSAADAAALLEATQLAQQPAIQDSDASTTEALLRTAFGDQVLGLGVRVLGVDAKQLFVILLTVAGFVASLGLYLAGKLGRAACRCDKRRLPPPKEMMERMRAQARLNQGPRPMRVASEDPSEREDILGGDEQGHSRWT